MKKLIWAIALFLLCITAFCVINYASGAEDGVVSISVQTYPTKTVYGAFEKFDSSGLTLRVTYENGSERIASGDEVGVIYRRDNCLRVGDNSVILHYGGARTSIPVTVNRIAYDLSVLELSSFSVTYNGKYQSYSKMLPTVIGQDGIPLIMSAVGGSINAGSYDIKIEFYTESQDYVLPDTRVVTMTILPTRPEVVWGDTSFVYDGKSKLPEAYYYDVNGNKVYPTVTGAAINAGSYTATASVTDSNYLLSNERISYEIKKADYDFSGVKWSTDSFVYNGSKQSISAIGLPDGVSIIGYTGDRATNAGRYKAVASLSWDSKNYNQPPELSHQWEILPAEYDMSHTVFVDAEYIYDGERHYPRLEGRMPTGADGITLGYTFSSGATHVSDGLIEVTVSFVSESQNYILPENQTATVRINPKGIVATWGEGSVFYSGAYNHPTVVADECELKVKGGGVNVGKYLATAYTENTDYFITNNTMEFEIKKATNAWIEHPKASTCYEGKEIALSAAPMFGTLNYLFYSDKNGENRITAPTSCGVYYAKITVSGTDNYTGLESEIISFEIIPIVAVSMEVQINKENIQAFDRLTYEDFICNLVNNDGSLESVDPASVKVVYENSDCFLRKDCRVDFIYGEFHISLPVSVELANYDLSGVKWENNSLEYDGKPKSPYLSGLPDGVGVVEYVGGDKTDAGIYTVSVILQYDGENYNEPIIPQCSFEIQKRPVDTPVISVVYNGRFQIPSTDSTLYVIDASEQYLDAGSYIVKAYLTDEKNYVFKDSMSAECDAVYQILPKTLTVSVSDVRKYLFEKAEDAEYQLNEDEIINGDKVQITQYKDGKYIYLLSDNPNYVLSVSQVRIQKLWYPSRNGAIVLFIILLVICLIVILASLAYLYRYKIAAAFSVLRCRWHNRGMDNPPPKDFLFKKSAEKYFFEENNNDDVLKQEDINPKEDIYTEIERFMNELPTLDEQDERENETTENCVQNDFQIEISPVAVDAEKADSLITDSMAKSLIKKDSEIIFTGGSAKGIINVDAISDNFAPSERVDVNALKKKGLISHDIAYLKVLARGSIDKPLSVYANDFSLAAVKMIALTGGEAIKIVTMKEKSPEN